MLLLLLLLLWLGETQLSYAAMLARWPRDGAGMSGIPSRSWPDLQPEASEAPA